MFCTRHGRRQILRPSASELSIMENINSENRFNNLENEPWAFPLTSPDFKIGKRLGGGAFGAVFLVNYKGQELAGKTHHALRDPEMYGLDDPDNLAHVLEEIYVEIKSLSSIQYPNIVQFRGVAYGFFESMVVPTWILMDYHPGKTLQYVLKNSPDRLMLGNSSCSFFKIVKQIALSLVHLHGIHSTHKYQRGCNEKNLPISYLYGQVLSNFQPLVVPMIHRDLKPSNIMIHDDDTVIILDLGLARIASLSSKTPTGTPDYLAPEVSTGHYGSPADIYSLGVICYEMLSGKSVKSTHLERLQEAHDFYDMKRKTRSMPSDWEDLFPLLLSCLSTDPSQRPTALDIASKCHYILVEA